MTKRGIYWQRWYAARRLAQRILDYLAEHPECRLVDEDGRVIILEIQDDDELANCAIYHLAGRMTFMMYDADPELDGGAQDTIEQTRRTLFEGYQIARLTPLEEIWK